MLKRSVILLLPLLVLGSAWVIGDRLEADKRESRIRQIVKNEGEIIKPEDNVYKMTSSGDAVAIANVYGYGGPITVAVRVNPEGEIVSTHIIGHKETVPFFKKILDNGYPEKYKGLKYNAAIKIGNDVDAVSGATLSLTGLSEAVKTAAGRGASAAFGHPVSIAEAKPVRFGYKELLLILLFLITLSNGFIRYSNGIQIKLRWGTLFTGALFLGFVYTVPLSIININSFVIGYWPDLFTHLYWYLILLIVFLPLILQGKTAYCDSFCPFGAAQEILKSIGGGKRKFSKKSATFLIWMQRILALALITSALIFRDPSKFNFEVFGTFFTLTGNEIQYVVTGIVVVASLFFTRPWCLALCPLRAVSDYIKAVRKTLLGGSRSEGSANKV